MDRIALDRPLRVRFVPEVTASETLSAGAARIALFNWLLARKTGGRVVLRMPHAEDAGAADRVRAAAARDLAWLGLDWDEEVPDRDAVHREHLERLLRSGAVDDRDGALWLRTRPGRTVVHDAIKGDIAFDHAAIPDFVVRGPDGRPSRLFATAVDDLTLGIDLVLRGEEHLDDTPRQLMLAHALGIAPPRYAHVAPILARHDGSPREPLPGIDELRRSGFLAEAVIEHLALLGWSPEDGREAFTLGELVQSFSLERVGRSASVFDLARLLAFNARALRALPRAAYHAALVDRMQRERLLEDPPPDAAHRWIDTFIEAFGGVVHTLDEAIDAIVALRAEAVTVPALELERLRNRQVLFFLDAVAQYVDDQPELRGLPLAHDLVEIAREFGLAPADALGAVRMALTGSHEGPPLTLLFPLLGHDRIMIRIGAVSSHILHGRGLQPIAYGPGGVPFETIQPTPPPGRATGTPERGS